MESDGDKSAHQMGSSVTAVKCSHACAAFAVEGDSLCLHRVIIPFKVIDVVSMCFHWYKSTVIINHY